MILTPVRSIRFVGAHIVGGVVWESGLLVFELRITFAVAARDR